MKDLSTPALLFPAISLLLLAYTNRFLALASLIRSLHRDYLKERSVRMARQIQNLRLRVHLIRAMQGLGVMSILACTICMGLIALQVPEAPQWVFGVSLAFMALSLACSLWEINISTRALDILMADMEAPDKGAGS